MIIQVKKQESRNAEWFLQARGDSNNYSKNYFARQREITRKTHKQITELKKRKKWD